MIRAIYLRSVNSTQGVKITQADAWVSGSNRRVAAKQWTVFCKGRHLRSSPPLSQRSQGQRTCEMFRAAGAPTVRARIASRLSLRVKRDNLVGHARAHARFLRFEARSPRGSSPGGFDGGGGVARALGSDGRDSIMSLVQLYHSAVKLGMGAAPEIFEQARISSGHRLRPCDSLRSLSRPPPYAGFGGLYVGERRPKDGFDYQLL